MPSRFATLITSVLVTLAQPALAQQSVPVPAALPLQFESWQAAPPHQKATTFAGKIVPEQEDRKNRWLIIGTVGAAAGVVFCTAMSTLMNDSASGGMSFCPLDSYLLIGSAGFLLGAAIGLAF